MVETPTAILDVRAIAGFWRVEVLVMGTNDLARELRASHSAADRFPVLPHLATSLLAAREAGKSILDGVFNDVKDLDGFREWYLAVIGPSARMRQLVRRGGGRYFGI